MIDLSRLSVGAPSLATHPPLCLRTGFLNVGAYEHNGFLNLEVFVSALIAASTEGDDVPAVVSSLLLDMRTDIGAVCTAQF